MAETKHKQPRRLHTTGNLLLARMGETKWIAAIAAAVALSAVTTATVSPIWAFLGWLVVCLTAWFTLGGSVEVSDIAETKIQPLSGPISPEVTSIIACLPDPCFLLRTDGHVVCQNDAAIDAIGLIEPGMTIFTLLRVPEIHDALAQIVRDGHPVRAEFVQPSPAERRFEAHMAISRENGSDSENLIVMILTDLTEQQQLDRMRADFVANASHELRTPLASLIGFVETLQGPAKNDDKAREQFLEIMVTQAQRMSRLIDDLLSLNQIEMNVHVRPSKKVNLSDVVRHVVDTLKPIASDAGVKIDLAIEVPDNGAAGGLHVLGTRDELVQVVQNLVENAIKYGQDGKKVEIFLTRKEQAGGPAKLNFGIRDFGPGIAAEHVPRLTERFYRVDVVSSREKGGTGLGLAIVKHILNRHRGKLQIESVPGEGSTFTVHIDEAS